uniref:Uncharacterized protein n=1 Tax=Acrobeloides nanus TaxID=290746 RepID=A0A914CHD7_9BILA
MNNQTLTEFYVNISILHYENFVVLSPTLTTVIDVTMWITFEMEKPDIDPVLSWPPGPRQGVQKLSAEDLRTVTNRESIIFRADRPRQRGRRASFLDYFGLD